MQGHQITIPAERQDHLGIPLRSTFSPEAPALEQNPETRADDGAPVVTKRRRILVVEDDSEICALLSDLLTEMGHEVTCAASDKEAYGAFQRETIEALVVDINLGRGTTGFDVARLARSFNPDLPVAYVTGGSPQSVARFGVEGGVLVSKPFDRELFIETMERMLSE